MPRWPLKLVLVLVCFAATCPAAEVEAPPRLDGARQTGASIDATVQKLMAAERVPGLALALVHDGKVAYRKTYGQRDVAAQLPLTTETVMCGASLTKATFAYFVMQL